MADAARWNRLHPGDDPRVPYVTELLADQEGQWSLRLTI